MKPFHTPKIVDKPWGREIWYADQATYAGKVLEVKKGKRLSLQYHEHKTETLFLLSGKVNMVFKAVEDPTASNVSILPEDNFIWQAGDAIHIPVQTIHRFEALEDSVLLEVSTPHLTDVVRLQDDYERPERGY